MANIGAATPVGSHYTINDYRYDYRKFVEIIDSRYPGFSIDFHFHADSYHVTPDQRGVRILYKKINHVVYVGADRLFSFATRPWYLRDTRVSFSTGHVLDDGLIYYLIDELLICSPFSRVMFNREVRLCCGKCSMCTDGITTPESLATDCPDENTPELMRVRERVAAIVAKHGMDAIKGEWFGLMEELEYLSPDNV
jgi:hypothetical protein